MTTRVGYGFSSSHQTFRMKPLFNIVLKNRALQGACRGRIGISRNFVRSKVTIPSTTASRNAGTSNINSTLLISTIVGASLLYYLTANGESIKLDAVSANTVLHVITRSELSKHNSEDDIWIQIGDKVYDLTEFLKIHPGGKAAILPYAGKDATKIFMKKHNRRFLDTLPAEACLGEIEPKTAAEKAQDEAREAEEEASAAAAAAAAAEIPKSPSSSSSLGKKRYVLVEEDIEEEKPFVKPPLAYMFNVNDFEAVAKRILPKDIYMYVATGSDDEATLRECHLAYSRIFFKPRVLRDVSDVDTSTDLLGFRAKLPFYITAFAGQSYLNEDADMVLARVAKKKGLMFMYSRLGAYPLKEVSEFFGERPFWCQVSFDWGDPTVTKALTEINKYDNIKGVFISTDGATGGNREKDFKTRVQEASHEELSQFSAPSHPYPPFTWNNVENLRKMTSKRLILKGVQSVEDVLMACERGLDGVVISCHGGRQLDYSQPPLEVLAEAMPLLREQTYYDKDKFQVFIDGGVRRGSDVLKAVALGASGVGIGKGFAFSVASYGQDGAEKLCDQLNQEISRDMKLLGLTSVSQLSAKCLNMKGFYNRIGNYDDSYFTNYERLPSPLK